MRHEEHQRFATWVYILVWLSIGGSILAVVMAAKQDPRVIWMLLLFLPALLWIVDMLHLYTRVANGEIYVQLGRFIPTFWKHLPLKDLSEPRVVQYHPLRDGGGWGWRIGRFEGEGCWFYNARGDRGVFIRTPERNYIIGSQEPEVLLQAIEDAIASGV